MQNSAPKLDLNSPFGFVFNGEAADDQLGSSVSIIGDINNDGFDDLLVGAPRHDQNGAANAGVAYVLFGSSVGLDSALDLSSLNGNNGFILNGIDEQDIAGFSVSGAGDLNNDGLDDIVIGAPQADNGTVLGAGDNGDGGESYVIFGQSGGFNSSLDLGNLDGTNGFTLSGAVRVVGANGGSRFGSSVSNLGDINGDNINDLIIGAPFSDPISQIDNGVNAGQAYVIYGKSTGFSSTFDLSNFDGIQGFIIDGLNASDRLGSSVGGSGDFNGDGISDILIGASSADPNGNSSGETYLIFGTQGGFGANFELSSLNGNNGLIINGIDSFDAVGSFIDFAGDINNDGFDDVLIGAPGGDANGFSSGESYIIFGTDSNLPANLELSSLNGMNGFIINGIAAGDTSDAHMSVSQAGDVNGDGVDDVLISAGGADPNGNSSGETYLIFGSSIGFSSSLDLSSLDGSNGFIINGIENGDFSGESVSGSGDLNGDGFDDIVIGAYLADPNGANSGEGYVIFGHQNIGSSGTLELSDIAINADGINFGTDFGGAPNIIVDEDLSIVDATNSTLVSATVRILNRQDGTAEQLIVDTSGTNITANFNANQGLLTLNGIASLRTYEEILRRVIYENNIASGSSRTIEFRLNDGESSNNLSPQARTTLDFNTLKDTAISVILGQASIVDINGGNSANDISISQLNGQVVIEEDSLSLNAGIGTIQAGLGRVETPFNSLTQPINIDLRSGNDSLTVNLAKAFTIIAGAGSDFISSGSRNDTINGGSGNDTLRGGGGNDSIQGEVGNDLTLGQNGNDTLRGGSGNDTIQGDAGNDRVMGDSGDDRLLGGIGLDTILGGADDDTLIGAAGNDVLRGENGNDSLNGGSGNDTLNGFNGNDTLNAASGNDRLEGLSGNDLLLGGTGSDTLLGQNNNDTLRGDIGNDSLNGGANNDRLQGDAGNDTLIGSTGNDTLLGNSGNDRLLGSSGNDALTGAQGNDFLAGGGNEDTFHFNGSFASLGFDQISDMTSIDNIVLSRATFVLGGATGGNILAGQFDRVGSIASAETSSARIVYNFNTNRIFYNANGSNAGFGSGGQFAVLSNGFNLTDANILLSA